MQVESDQHLAEELLEKYAMGNVAEEQIPPLEEHLYVCSACQDRFTDIDSHVQLMRAATAEVERQLVERKPRLSALLQGRFWHIPKPVWASGLAAVAALVIATVIPFGNQTRPATVINLSASLRATSEPVAAAHAGGRLLLKVDSSTIPPAPSYQLRLVGSEGEEIWNARVIAHDHQILAPVPQKLRAGRYWVRLYSGTDSSRLLQEFALQLK